MGRGEGPVQRRHRRQLCERVQYVRERVSGKSVRRRVPGGRVGEGGRVGLGDRPSAARPLQPSGAPCAAASSLRGSSSPGGQLPVPSPAATPLHPASHGAQRGTPQLGTLPGRRALVPGSRAGGMGGSEARARVRAPAQ